MRPLHKAFKYPNIFLISRIIQLQREISGRKGNNVFDLLERTPVAARRGLKKETIDHYVPPALRLGAAFGLLNTCLTRSVVRCILRRENGIPSRVAFGLRKDGGLLQGHCWLEGEEPGGASAPFDSVVVCPKGEKDRGS